MQAIESTMSNSLQWRPTPLHLRALACLLALAIVVFGGAIDVGGRSFPRHPLLGTPLMVFGAIVAALSLRPIAAQPRAWAEQRRRIAGLKRDRKLRASRKQFVEARRIHARHVDDIYRSPSDS